MKHNFAVITSIFFFTLSDMKYYGGWLYYLVVDVYFVFFYYENCVSKSFSQIIMLMLPIEVLYMIA